MFFGEFFSNWPVCLLKGTEAELPAGPGIEPPTSISSTHWVTVTQYIYLSTPEFILFFFFNNINTTALTYVYFFYFLLLIFMILILFKYKCYADMYREYKVPTQTTAETGIILSADPLLQQKYWYYFLFVLWTKQFPEL